MKNIMRISIFAVIFILITLAIYFIMMLFSIRSQDSPGEGRTYVLLGYIKSDLRIYWLTKGKLPDSISVPSLIRAFNIVSTTDYAKFINSNGDSFIDGWGSPLIIYRIGDHQFQFRSLGADKVINTKDDITDHWSIPIMQIPGQ